MTFNELRKGERWMTEEELRLIRRYVLCMKNFLIARGVEESPLLCFRVGDLGLQWLIVRRLENGLAQQENCEKTELPLATTALADHIGKGRYQQGQQHAAGQNARHGAAQIHAQQPLQQPMKHQALHWHLN